MNFYQSMFGTNPNSDIVLNLLNEGQSSDKAYSFGTFGRYRDCWLERNVDNPKEALIAVYGRIGGYNRARYQHVFEEVRTHPWWLRDADDTFDNTYATIYFKIPIYKLGMLLDEYGIVIEDIQDHVNKSQEWKDKIDKIQTSSKK